MNKFSIIWFFFFIFTCQVLSRGAASRGHGDDTAFWKKRARESRNAAIQNYKSNPYDVASFVNHRIHKTKNYKHSRRVLSSEACNATNPIDKCWRCKSNWAENRQRLADCVIGFGHSTTGGKGGRIYVVNDSSDASLIDPKPGTLRHAVIQPEPLWIIFKKDMNIKLSQELIMAGNKTIDGRGANVHITGGSGFTLQFISNVIIHGIHIHDIKPANGGMIRDSTTHYGFRTKSDGDGISIIGASNIWIDHLSMARCADGLIDAVSHSTAITISNSYYTEHDHVMLFGASEMSPEDSLMQVTLAFNHFGPHLVQRMPRVRFGFAHVVNNDYTKWEMFAIAGTCHPTILSQGNHYVAPDNNNTKQVTRRDYTPESEWKKWVWKSQGDVFENGAFFVESGDANYRFALGSSDMVPPKSGQFAVDMAKYAGALSCVPGKPC